MKKIIEFLNHERYQVVAVAICTALLIWIFSCQSTTRSPSDPTIQVTAVQLDAEIDYYLARCEIAYQDIEQQDAIKQKLLDAAAIAAQGGQVNIVGLLLANLGILGAGATVDNVRKRRDLKKALHYEKPDAN